MHVGRVDAGRTSLPPPYLPFSFYISLLEGILSLTVAAAELWAKREDRRLCWRAGIAALIAVYLH